ncbi:MAG: hypothetical protein HGN29_05780 [Asgard group archaeon]|nr:hypothetical protein [Asgard group archaeon]
MSFKSDVRRKIEYQCNTCGKLRLLFIAPALQSDKVEQTGYIEYCDVHICKNKNLNAIKLCVDHNYDVRSQVTVETKTSSEEPAFTEIEGLNIPTPKKAELREQEIIPTRDFGAYSLKRMVIKDKLRQSSFLLEGVKEGVEVIANSPLNFIEIDIFISEDINTETVYEWLLSLSNILESLVYLDESLLSYLGTYLDHMIISPPKEKELLELSLLLNSTVAIPHSTDEHIKIFEEHVNELFPELNVVSYRMYRAIMEACLKNEQNRVIDIYEDVKKKIVQIQAFPYFISIIGTLVSFGFINLEKLEFYSISEF